MSSKSLSEQTRTKVHLYDDPSVENMDLTELASYLETRTPFGEIDVRGPLTNYFQGDVEELAERIARTRVRNPETLKSDFDPLYGGIRFEEGLIRDPSSKFSGVLYDGFDLDRVFRDLLPVGERTLSHIHIVFTNRLFGTWDEGDNRYHARVSIYGFPCLISTTGIVEAPAKPKEFYRKKRQRARLGQTAGVIEDLKKEFEGEFVDYDDERLTEVLKGYVLQAIFHNLTSNPFCDDEHCRLYNAHWQEEVLQAQLESPEFCEEHENKIKEWKSSSGSR